MRAVTAVLSAIILGLIACSAIAAPEEVGLDWLAGAWVSDADGRWTEEWWTPPRGGMMLGGSRAGEGGAVREFEHLRISVGGDGRMTYHAMPGGGPAVAFQEQRRAPGSITFANPAHDYPQRISYARDGDRLTATISLMDGSRAASWTYTRE